ncbi:hypothetical protein PB01_00915 [Psychrobacillus glaciei]|uniref:Uncharacterized protein n=1 Tax=Psychrobacillus glaciei TaxID=2283160 RepID=A0A5J6SHV7_9BACI|nr:hypothetical protein [Psychrobacillus glaciei]QFF97486.1 hypothetical protein PB01_00915 [Psychrobacillus glaciei]
MSKIKKIIQIIIVSALILFIWWYMGSNFSNKDLKKPIQEYLATNYGLNEDFTILSTDNNWFEGVDHQTIIEIKKPYISYPYLQIERDSLQILDNESDDIYIELFKGAYIEQHPEVFKISNQLIQKYGLVKNSPNEWDVAKQNYYYYLQLNIDSQQEKELLDKFTKNNSINTIDIVPMLKRSEPIRNASYIGVINFIYQFDQYKKTNNVPKAMDIVEDFINSGVFMKGVYNIYVQTINTGPDMKLKDPDAESHVLFSVDENGNHEIIPTPKELY